MHERRCAGLADKAHAVTLALRTDLECRRWRDRTEEASWSDSYATVFIQGILGRSSNVSNATSGPAVPGPPPRRAKPAIRDDRRDGCCRDTRRCHLERPNGSDLRGLSRGTSFSSSPDPTPGAWCWNGNRSGLSGTSSVASRTASPFRRACSLLNHTRPTSAPSSVTIVTGWRSTSGSGEVESIEIHDLVPRGYEITHELLLRVVAPVDLRECTKLGVRTEDEVDAASGPLGFARREVAALEDLLGPGRRLPRRLQVEQAHEEVVGQRPEAAW